MSNQNDQREPSMEEILASIRQIISEDGDEVPGKTAPQPTGPDAPPTPAPLDLTQVVNEDGSVTDLNEPARAPNADADTVNPDTFDPDAFGEPLAPSQLAEKDPVVFPDPEGEPSSYPGLPADDLVSPDRASAVQSALGLLTSQTRVRGQADPATLEGLVTEMLRPMLKQWLDANLPRLVDRAVREEIERIAKRAG